MSVRYVIWIDVFDWENWDSLPHSVFGGIDFFFGASWEVWVVSVHEREKKGFKNIYLPCVWVEQIRLTDEAYHSAISGS